MGQCRVRRSRTSASTSTSRTSFSTGTGTIPRPVTVRGTSGTGPPLPWLCALVLRVASTRERACVVHVLAHPTFIGGDYVLGRHFCSILLRYALFTCYLLGLWYGCFAALHVLLLVSTRVGLYHTLSYGPR